MLKNWHFLRVFSLALLGMAACGQGTPAAGVSSSADGGAVPTLGTDASDTPPPRPTALVPPPGWKLAWHDEFDGPAGAKPDPANWGYDLGAGGWGNNEMQYYTDRAENAAMDGKGSLAITAIEYTDPATSGLDCSYCMYSSARLVTRHLHTFTYGRVEARMRLPVGQGVWPAFWMLGSDLGQVAWPQCGEIDVMENIGSEPGVVHAAVHGPDYSGGKAPANTFTLAGARFADDFHVFTVEWDAAEIRWYVDGQQYFSAAPEKLPGRWVFDHPFYLILNLAIGGTFSGMPDYTSVFPQTLLVDYVRVYQR